MTDAPAGVKLILDASALKAYGHNPTIGEMLGEVEDEEGLVAISQGSLAQALAEGADRALLELLIQRDSCVVLPPMNDWEDLGAFLRQVGPRQDLHDAFLTLAAFFHRAYILTSESARYVTVHKAVRCIAIHNPWKG